MKTDCAVQPSFFRTFEIRRMASPSQSLDYRPASNVGVPVDDAWTHKTPTSSSTKHSYIRAPPPLDSLLLLARRRAQRRCTPAPLRAN